MVSGLYRALLRIGKIATAITFLLGPIYAWSEHESSKRKAQFAESKELLAQYYSGDLAKVRRNIASATNMSRDDLVRLSKDGVSVNAYMLSLIKGKYDNDVDIIVEFFDRAAKCMELNYCSSAYIASMIGNDIVTNYNNLYPYIVYARDTNNRYACGLENLRALLVSTADRPAQTATPCRS